MAGLGPQNLAKHFNGFFYMIHIKHEFELWLQQFRTLSMIIDFHFFGTLLVFNAARFESYQMIWHSPPLETGLCDLILGINVRFWGPKPFGDASIFVPI